MSAFGKARGGGRRRAARTAAPVLAVLSTVTDDHRVGLINVSNTGVRVTAPTLPKLGEDVIFKSGKVQSFGQVVWAEGSQCGVAFESAIGAEDVECLREQAHIFGMGNMSAAERAAAEDWTTGTAH